MSPLWAWGGWRCWARWFSTCWRARDWDPERAPMGRKWKWVTVGTNLRLGDGTVLRLRGNAKEQITQYRYEMMARQMAGIDKREPRKLKPPPPPPPPEPVVYDLPL